MQQYENKYIPNDGCGTLVAYLAAGGWYGVVCSAQLRWHFQRSCSTDPGEPRSLWWLRMPGWWPSTHWTPWRQSWLPVRPGHWRRPESAGLTFGALRYFLSKFKKKKRNENCCRLTNYTVDMCFIEMIYRQDISRGQWWTQGSHSEIVKGACVDG